MSGKKSFESVYQDYYLKVFQHIYRKINIWHEAEELTQEVFVACYLNYDRYDPDRAAVWTWLYVIMNNKLKNYYRDKKDTLSIDDEELLPELAGDDFVEEAVMLEEQKRVLFAAIDRLTEREQQIVKERYFHGKTSIEIGAALKMSDAGVRMALKRALAKIRGFLEAQGY
ncbi:MAG: sigma-70 family RNA polymerase sigma factor [Clostridiales bacterium]|nr:sigma-70 family RNA polymerase sigma factor [Clostridiales bacterium]